MCLSKSIIRSSWGYFVLLKWIIRRERPHGMYSSPKQMLRTNSTMYQNEHLTWKIASQQLLQQFYCCHKWSVCDLKMVLLTLNEISLSFDQFNMARWSKQRQNILFFLMWWPRSLKMHQNTDLHCSVCV